jgi:hypothetical protein
LSEQAREIASVRLHAIFARKALIALIDASNNDWADNPEGDSIGFTGAQPVYEYLGASQYLGYDQAYTNSGHAQTAQQIKDLITFANMVFYNIPLSSTTNGWLALIEDGPSGDVDSDLRVALLALLGGGERRLAADFLRQSADRKMESVAASEPTGNPGDLLPLPRWYNDLRSSTAKALLTAESSAIRAMADALPRKFSGKPRHSTRAAKKQKGS